MRDQVFGVVDWCYLLLYRVNAVLFFCVRKLLSTLPSFVLISIIHYLYLLSKNTIKIFQFIRYIEKVNLLVLFLIMSEKGSIETALAGMNELPILSTN